MTGEFFRFSDGDATMNTQRNATLTVDGKNIDLPVYSGSMGPEVIDNR